MSYIGHTDARRRLTPTGWEYQDRTNQTFAEGLQFFGLSLPDVDAHIEALEASGDPHAGKLREHRTLALKERQSLDFSMRYLEAVLMHKRDRDAAAQIKREKAEKREAWMVAQSEQDAAKKAQKGTQKKLTAEQEKEIREKLAKRQSASSLAKQYGVSRTTIGKYQPAKQKGVPGPFTGLGKR